MSTRHKYSLPVLAIALAALIALPATAEAQRRGFRGRSPYRVVVGAGFGFGYPSFWLYDQWGPWGPYGPGPWGPYRAYPPYLINEFTAALKFDVKPKDADVYVDGALAGRIDDFDGIFQSLKLRPGSHEIVVYREGFRSMREQVYLEPFHERKLRFDLEPLRAGEPQDSRPMGPPPDVARDRDPRPGPPPQREPVRRTPPPDPRPSPAQFGTLSIRVMPADAEVFVDGERWTGSPSGDRLTLQLSAGRHRIEVRKQGFATYAEEVLIRTGATLTLNVSLK